MTDQHSNQPSPLGGSSIEKISEKADGGPSLPPRLRLRVAPAAETAIRKGHPWVFSESVRESNRKGTVEDLAVIFDRNDRFLAAGLFDPDSPLRVRILVSGKPATVDAAWWAARLETALRRRDGLFNPDTNGFRLINGESDGWPGLVLDRYAETLVLKLYTGSWFPRLKDVLGLITARFPEFRVVLRLSRNIEEAAKARLKAGQGAVLAGGPLTGPVVFREYGLRFESDVLLGQKTGFFLDQRENRRCVGELSRGADMLNAFSFSGGFSLYAARGGAKSATDLDISGHALDAARRNFALNTAQAAVKACEHHVAQADAFEWIRGTDRKFDLIVLDPPSLAKRERDREGALKAYGQLASDAVGRLKKGGTLVSASCSAHVPAEDFFSAIRLAVRRSGRRFNELRTERHPADHPATFREAEYLKAVYLKFD